MDVIIAGGGLSGLAAAVALAQHGFEVELFEAKPFTGGRATSYQVPNTEEEIDNCQHILLRCCVNLLDFYRRMGVQDAIEFHREFHFIEPGGRLSPWRRGLLPAPAHFTGAFASARWLTWSDKFALARAMLAVMRERKTRRDLDEISMLDWLRAHGQPERVIERFWRQVLVSAINVELDDMAAAHGFQVIWLGFLAAPDSYEMGVPRIPLGQLYSRPVPNATLHTKSPITNLDPAQARVEVNGEWREARALISALPSDKLQPLAPDLPIPFEAFEPSSIIGIHLWFDRPVTDLPHGTLLERRIQWFFNKGEGKYLMLVISAAGEILRQTPKELAGMALQELAEFLPAVNGAQLVKHHVVKEPKATYRARPGLEGLRPVSITQHPKFFLAGDWTKTGWPATMEGAVRGGYLAAEAAANYLGKPGRFLLPDIA
jgi:squalene-associated FAD-dependent desaturase